MRHNKKKITLGRLKAQRTALLRGLADSFIMHGAIVTTKAKAKALKTFVEPLVTKAARNRPVDRKIITSTLYTGKAMRKLIDEIGPRYKDRKGGYTRIINIGFRESDKGEKARIEFV